MLGGFKWHSNRGEGGADGRPCDPGLPGVPLNRQGDTQKLSHTLSPSAGPRALWLQFELQTPLWSLASNSTWISQFLPTMKNAIQIQRNARSFFSLFPQYLIRFVNCNFSPQGRLIQFFNHKKSGSGNLELTGAQTIHHFQTWSLFHINSGCVCAHAKALPASVAAACLLGSV